jgi:hypothetical protein
MLAERNFLSKDAIAFLVVSQELVVGPDDFHSRLAHARSGTKREH